MEEPIQYTEEVFKVVTDCIQQFFNSRNELARIMKKDPFPEDGKEIYEDTLALTNLIDDLIKLPGQKEDFIKTFTPMIKETRQDLLIVGDRLAQIEAREKSSSTDQSLSISSTM